MAAKKRKKRASEEKAAVLREHGSLNPHPERVTDPLFLQHDFFDALDSVQVKYEMLRRVRAEGESVSAVAREFGYSRPSFYQSQSAFQEEGITGLVPKKRGPRAAHKLTDEVVEFVERVIDEEEEAPDTTALAARIKKRFGVVVHPRSIERALARKKKRQ